MRRLSLIDAPGAPWAVIVHVAATVTSGRLPGVAVAVGVLVGVPSSGAMP